MSNLRIPLRLLALVLSLDAIVALAATNGLQPGLALTFTSRSADTSGSDVIVAPNAWLHVAGDETPSPFLAPGPFMALWRGYLSVELQSIHAFQAEVNGSLRVVVNAREVLNVTGDGGMSDAGTIVRLNKGLNEVQIDYLPAGSGDAHMRLFWTPRGSSPRLIPSNAWSHEPDTALLAARQRQRGRELILEHRCVRCHGIDGDGVPELLMNAPTFEGIASRCRPEWIREWLGSANRTPTGARMPAMFHGGEATHASEAVAAFLGTLTDPEWSAAPEPVEPDVARAGGRLFQALHCGGCHLPPGSSGTNTNLLLTLDHVSMKFTPGALAKYLLKPAEHHGSTRMPDFRLSKDEATVLAAHLRSQSSANATEPPRPELAIRGRELVQSTGCLNCHSLELDNRFSTRRLVELGNWEAGCLSRSPLTGTHVPYFGFPEDDRRALREFAAGGFPSLTRHVEAEFAARQVKHLNCMSCHDHQIAQVPHLDVLGGKIKPEYGTELIAGRVAEKPRPWIEARMPGFPAYAAGVARGLANLHGFRASTPAPVKPVDEEYAGIGFKLMQPEGGFACVSCHAIGNAVSVLLPESPGVNFAWTFERLQHDYFRRWMRNPLAVDPSTRMPVFFDDSGRSPIPEVLNGEPDKQIEALWHYLRQERRLTRPAGIRPSRDTE